ncbi:MAG: hypothetical protein J6W81_05305 [Lentisphaeria bacterium]|nr:hypothetical protein [Lentisphaeria bacterium]
MKKCSLRGGIAICFLLLGIFLTAEATEKIDPEKIDPERFLGYVRNPPGRDSWASLKGTAQHLRDNSRPVQAKIEMGIFFTPVRTLAQIRFNGNEVYTIGQSYGKDGATNVEKRITDGKKAQIGIYGITPEDLALSFLYWKFVKEEAPVTVRMEKCRVFRLESKDRKEQVVVTISCQYLFPFKAEWYRKDSKEPVRKLEAAAFRKNNDYWFITKINLSGKGWFTTIRFNDVNAGPFKQKLPEGLFQ